MVDVSAGSEKLVDRARRIVATASGRPLAEAAAALEAANGEVKTAVVALLAGIDPPAARLRLAAANGIVRQALS
jgi:N-acetylmuramic acid 6-phosphate etherase